MQPNEFKRPDGKTELETREAHGLWKAITLAKELGESDEEISLNLILRINETIFKDAVPESAGKFRVTGQDVKPLPCVEPPPGVAIRELMIKFEGDLKHRLATLVSTMPNRGNKKKYRKWAEGVIDVAAWVQHTLVQIHPFCDGNGRTARLMTNVILRRFNFHPTDIKIEAEDKEHYINALCQIDKYGDYQPLRSLILKGSIATMREEIKRKRHSKLSR
jgi:fido (protein-threonine AMPylation protein)